MNLIQKLNEALQWYQKGYHITNDPESIKVEHDSRELMASFGSMDVDDFKVSMYFHNDGSLNRIFFNCGSGSLEVRDQTIADNLLYMNGDFVDFIYDSIAKIEKIAEERYRKQKQARVSFNPLD